MNFKQKVILGISFLVGTPASFAQESTELGEVVVSTARTEVGISDAARTIHVISRQEIEDAPVESIPELLEFVTSLDIRQRSPNGVQADVSLRGSSFEQVAILLNGVKMSDPQTGHHQLNLPIELMDIERIEVVYGGASRVFGPGAFAGAINIITKNPTESRIRANLEAGDYGYLQGGASAVLAYEKHAHSFSLVRRQADGPERNQDFQLTNFFWQSDLNLEDSKWFFNFGQNEKEFGAQNFYSTRFPDQYEATKAQFVSAGGHKDFGSLRISPKAYYRVHNDRFELFREGDGYYHRLPSGGFANNEGDTITWYNGHNYHQSDVFGAEINASYEWKLGTTSLGYDYREERIKSNVLGEPLDHAEEVSGEHPSALYTNGADRQNQSVYIEHNYAGKNLFISAGAMFNTNSDYGDEIFPGADIAYQVSETFRPYVSANRAFRVPSYTELYYNLGGAVGSQDLSPESSINLEVGVHIDRNWAKGHLAVFNRQGENLIDWIRFVPDGDLIASNISELDMSGVETAWRFDVSKMNENSALKTISANYTYLTADYDPVGIESIYVLDYLESKFDLGFHFTFWKTVELDLNMSYQDRVGEFTQVDGSLKAYDPVFLTDLRISPRIGKARLFVQVSNLFNQHYFDLGGVQQPGRWMRAGVTFDFGI